jgi:signal transduction histidine kinase
MLQSTSRQAFDHGPCRQLAEHSLNGVAHCRVIYDDRQLPCDWVYLYVNQAFLSQTGMADPTGLRASDVIPGIHLADPRLVEIYSRVAATGAPERFDTHVDALGHWFTVSVYSPETGEFVACFNVVTDEKKRADSLQRVQEKLSLAQKASQAGFWDWDLPSGEIEWTDEMFAVLGLDPCMSSASFDTWRNAVHPEDREVAESQILRSIEEKTPLFNRYRIILPSGECRWIEAFGSTIYEQTGLPVRMTGICLDITDARALKDRLAQADAASHAKSSFISTMSHELRTPLNAIIGFSTLIVEGATGPLNEEQHRQLGIVRQSGQQLLDLVNDILDIAGIESGRSTIDLQPAVIAPIVRDEVSLFELRASARGLDLRYRETDGGAIALVDKRRLRQVVANFVSNALTYTDKGFVEVSVKGTPSAVRIAVKDTGIGIPEDQIAKLFVPFYRVDGTAWRSRPGTGLGLAISRRLIDAMNGDIGVTTTEGLGSEFWITLPVSSDFAAPD